VGAPATRVTTKTIDEIALRDAPHPWALPDEPRNSDPVERYLAERRAERAGATKADRLRAAAQRRWGKARGGE